MTGVEVLGLFGSIAAIDQLAHATFKSARYIYRTAQNLKAVRPEIESFGKTIEDFSNILDAAYFTLNWYYKTNKAHTPVLDHIRRKSILSGVVAQAERLNIRIRTLKPRFSSLQSDISLLTRIKWVKQKKYVLALNPDMESVKLSLHMLVNFLNLEATMSQSQGLPSKEVRRQIKRLMGLIRRQTERIRILKRDRYELAERVPGRFRTYDEDLNDLRLDEEIQNDLLELAQMIVPNTQVPRPPSNSTSTLRSSHTSRTEPSTRSYTILPTGVTDGGPLTPTSRYGRRINIDSTPTHLLTSGTSRHPSPDVIAPSGNSQVSSFVPGSPPLPKTLIAPMVAKQTERTLPASEAQDHVVVRPLNYLLHFDRTAILSSVSGQVNGGHEVTALLDQHLPQNIISARLAAQLRLTIDPHEDGDDRQVIIEFGDGSVAKSKGQVSFVLQQGRKRLTGIQCLVYEHGVRDLVLGEPFAKRRLHCWHHRRDATADGGGGDGGGGEPCCSQLSTMD